MTDHLPSAAAVVFVDDVERMAAFYEAVGGLRRLQGDGQHVVIEAAGLQITIHALRRRGARPATYPLRHDSSIKLCLPVDRIARARAAAAALGGEVWPPNKEWEAGDRGFRACDGRDPEGNVFQVREALGDATAQAG